MNQLAKERRSVGLRAFAVGVAQAVLWGLLVVLLAKVVPSFEKIFQELGTDLPSVTIGVVDTAHVLRHFWFPICVLIGLWPFAQWGIAYLLSLTPERLVLKWLWYCVTWLLPIAFGGIVVVALFRPLILVMRSL